MPATESHELHHPATVGSTFMRQYYHFLAKEPASLHRFYKDESTWCHGVGSHMQESISGQRAINEEILRRGYEGARVDLDAGSIDCQASLHGGVFVLVTGVMTLASSAVPKPFVQTFFLAVQPKGYFVLNDCLRFLELPTATTGTSTVTAKPSPKKQVQTPVKHVESVPVTVASPKKENTKQLAPEAPKTPVKIASPVKTTVASPKPKEPAPAPASTAPVAAPSSPVKKTTTTPEAKKPATPKPSETKPATPASPVAKPATPAKVASPIPAPAAAAPAKPVEPVAPAAPKTWAALFTPAVVATVATKPVAASNGASVASKPTPATTVATVTTTTATTEASAAAPQEKEKKRYFSLFIRDVPTQTKEAELRELFKSYGSIANVAIPGGRGFAFVDFYEQESMRAVLADGEKEFKVHDKVLQVGERTERKNDKERGSFRADNTRGGRGGGRGGAPKSGGRVGDRKEREDGREHRGDGANNGKPTTNGPRHPSGERRDKGGRRSGKEDGGRGNTSN